MHGVNPSGRFLENVLLFESISVVGFRTAHIKARVHQAPMLKVKK